MSLFIAVELLLGIFFYILLERKICLSSENKSRTELQFYDVQCTISIISLKHSLNVKCVMT